MFEGKISFYQHFLSWIELIFEYKISHIWHGVGGGQNGAEKLSRINY